MECSPLVGLPAELRNVIFGWVLVAPGGIHVDINESRVEATSGASDGLALMATCKHMRRECHVNFFAANDWVLHNDLLTQYYHYEMARDIRVQLFMISDWLCTLGQGEQHLRTLKIDLGSWDVYSSPDVDELCPIVRRYEKALRAMNRKVIILISLHDTWNLDYQGGLELSPLYDDAARRHVRNIISEARASAWRDAASARGRATPGRYRGTSNHWLGPFREVFEDTAVARRDALWLVHSLTAAYEP